jgi:hypothetical protein
MGCRIREMPASREAEREILIQKEAHGSAKVMHHRTAARRTMIVSGRV